MGSLWMADVEQKADIQRLAAFKSQTDQLVGSMVRLLDLLVDSTRIMNSPMAASLLTLPLNEEDQETNAAWSSAENIIKSLKVTPTSIKTPSLRITLPVVGKSCPQIFVFCCCCTVQHSRLLSTPCTQVCRYSLFFSLRGEC